MRKTAWGFGLMVALGVTGSAVGQNATGPVATDHPHTATSAPADASTPESFEFVIVTFLEHNTAKIAFDKGTADLTDSEHEHLTDFVRRMRDEGSVRKFVLASWSDEDYPVSGKNLPSAERKLAKERADQVGKALKDAGAGSVETFLMTSRPNWFQRTFATDAAKVKGAPDLKLTNDAIERIGSKLRDRGGPGTVVIGAMFKDNSYAH